MKKTVKLSINIFVLTLLTSTAFFSNHAVAGLSKETLQQINEKNIPTGTFYPIVSEKISCADLFKSPVVFTNSSRFKKSQEEFRYDVEQAQRNNPGLFTAVEVQEIAYRIDRRPPQQIIDVGGFWPNPNKEEGSVEGHTIASTGNGSYLSFSWEHNETGILRNSFFIPSTPGFIVRNKAVQIMSHELWLELQNTNFPLNDDGKVSGDPPDHFGWVIYEYKIPGIKGTRVIGGQYRSEKEIITNGVLLSEHPDSEYRQVVITTKAQFSKFGNSDGSQFQKVRAGSKTQTKIEYGEWKPLH